MDIRETINENKKLSFGILGGIGALILIIILTQIFGGSATERLSLDGLYFSDDDGATFFEDDKKNLPPFTRNGKDVVRARVFSCDGGKTKFVGYLERYSAATLVQLNKAKGTPDEVRVRGQAATRGCEYKKPGTGNKWVEQNSPAAQLVQTVRCPNADAAAIEYLP